MFLLWSVIDMKLTRKRYQDLYCVKLHLTLTTFMAATQKRLAYLMIIIQDFLLRTMSKLIPIS